MAVSKYKGLHSPSSRLFGQILDKVEAPLESNHLLMDIYFSMGTVFGAEVGEKGVEKRANLEEWIVTRLTFWNVLCIVI